jgi:XRE family transcriptional regulator, regulator of sulfur utilization
MIADVDPVRLSAVIVRLRKANHMTQSELATLAGVHRNYIGQIERGEANLTIRTLQRVCACLGYDVLIGLRETD